MANPGTLPSARQSESPICYLLFCYLLFSKELQATSASGAEFTFDKGVQVAVHHAWTLLFRPRYDDL